VRCSFTKADQSQCQRIVSYGSKYCYGHDPAKAEERSRNAKKAGRIGGKGRPSAAGEEITDLKRHVDKLAMRVLDGSISRGDAVAVVQVWNLKARLIGLEMQIKEATETEARLTSLERRYSEAKTGGLRR
jgi:hypothetical protein